LSHLPARSHVNLVERLAAVHDLPLRGRLQAIIIINGGRPQLGDSLAPAGQAGPQNDFRAGLLMIKRQWPSAHTKQIKGHSENAWPEHFEASNGVRAENAHI